MPRAERGRERPVRGARARRQDRARGIDVPCRRANASARPGSGGRHQHVGGPPGCGQIALSTGPRDVAASAGDGGVEVGRGRRPGRQSKTRCGASGRLVERSLPARRPQRRGRDEHAGRAASRRRARRTATRSTPAKPSSSDGGSSSRSARICDVGASRPGSRRASARSSSGRRQRAEAVEQPLDEVDLRLGERRVEPDAPHRERRGGAAASTT